jgi:hypothetical protein
MNRHRLSASSLIGYTCFPIRLLPYEIYSFFPEIKRETRLTLERTLELEVT